MISTYDWFIARCKAVLNHSRPPEPPMRVRLHEAGHAVAGHRFGYMQQGIMLREDDTGETSQQYATGMDDDMSVRLQTEIIISMTGPDAEELESIRKEYRRQTERDERISRRAAELRHDRLNRTGRQQGEES